MSSNSITATFGLFCALAGLVHVLAPDHWVPASILSWKRGWRFRQIAFFSFMAYVAHVFLGFLIFWIFFGLFARVPSSGLLYFSLFLIGSVALIRGIRLGRIEAVLRAGPGGFWGLLTVFSLLGPCESIIPILMKARLVGSGYLLPFSAFLLGSIAGGVFLIHSGRMIWNRPHWFPRGIQWIKSQRMTVSMMIGVVVGLTWLLNRSY